MTKQKLKDRAVADRRRAIAAIEVADAARDRAVADWNKADAMPDDIAPSP